MSATKAFDLALFVPTPSAPQDGVVVNAVGPPFTTKFAPLVTGGAPGVTVGSSMPAANAQNQILISGVGPGFAWGLGTNPAAAASVPPPTGSQQLVLSDGTPAWQVSTIVNVLALGGAVTQANGGVLAVGANLVFATGGASAKRIDGGDPTLSQLDNFALDCGTF